MPRNHALRQQRQQHHQRKQGHPWGVAPIAQHVHGLRRARSLRGPTGTPCSRRSGTGATHFADALFRSIHARSHRRPTKHKHMVTSVRAPHTPAALPAGGGGAVPDAVVAHPLARGPVRLPSLVHTEITRSLRACAGSARDVHSTSEVRGPGLLYGIPWGAVVRGATPAGRHPP